MEQQQPADPDKSVVESIQETELARWSPRRLGIPALLDWWPSYVVMGAAAVLAVLATARMVFEIAAPLAHVFVVLTFAAALTFALAPVADTLEERLKSRALGVLVIATVILISFAVIATAVVAGIAAESGRLASAITEYTEAVQGRRALMLGDRPLNPEIAQHIRDFMAANGEELADLSGGLAFAVAATVVDTFLVLVLTIYLLLDARRISVRFQRALHPSRRRVVRRVVGEVARVFGAYLRAQLIVAASLAVLVTGMLFALGVPYALMLGIFAGITELIPIIGPVIGAIPAILVSSTLPFPTVLWVIAGFIVIQQLESNVLIPRLLGGAIGLHPVAAILALLAGFQIGGPVGAMIAVPVTGLTWVFLSTAALAWRGKRIELSQRQRRPWRVRRRARTAQPAAR